MQSSYNGIPVPAEGKAIEYKDGKYTVPDRPIIPFIEGDGTGRDIWKASQRVFDAAVEKAYGGKRKVEWYEVLAGEKSYRKTQNWLPDDTVKATIDFRVSIKGPLTTPVGGGIRSLNVALRQLMDLYQCIRPVKYYAGVPSPVKHPEKLDVVIFRENTEDIYAGIEFREGTPEAAKVISFINDDMLKGGKKKIRLDSGVGIKPISITGSKRLVRAAIQYALDNKPQDRDAGAQGQHPEVHRGRLPRVGLRGRIAGVPRADRHRARKLDPRQRRSQPQHHAGAERRADRAGHRVRRQGVRRRGGRRGEAGDRFDRRVAWRRQVEVEDSGQRPHRRLHLPADHLRPEDYSVLATTNLNGDYISDAAAAQVGGLGIAPGGNIGDGYAVFEATHGTAPKYADKDVINPGSVMLSGVMMFDFLGWTEAARLIENSLEKTIAQKFVTYDFERGMQGATKVKTSEFATRMIEQHVIRAAARRTKECVRK